MKNAYRFAYGLCFLLMLIFLIPACRKVQVLQPSGPIVPVPPGMIFGENNNARKPSNNASSRRTRGSTSMSRKVTSEQVARAERQLRLRPNDPKTQNDAGATFVDSGDIKRGVDLLAEARANAPEDPTIAYNYARALHQQGRADEAMAQTEAALQLQPEFDDARLLEASIAIQKDDYDAADRHIRKLLNKIQMAARVTQAIIRTVQGVIELKRGKLDAALSIFQEIASTEPQDSVALYNLGVAQQHKENFSEAENLYRQALQRDPELAEAHNNLGTVIAQKGESEKAFEEFHEAWRLRPSDHSIGSNLSGASLDGRETEDVLVGEWVFEGGAGQIKGTINGQWRSVDLPVPAGSIIRISKEGNGQYRIEQQGLSTTVRIQPGGSYQGSTIIPPGFQLPPGANWTGNVTFWVRGNNLFGDTTDKLSAPAFSMQGGLHWKARRNTRS